MNDVSWKGEHRIRAPEPDQYEITLVRQLRRYAEAGITKPEAARRLRIGVEKVYRLAVKYAIPFQTNRKRERART